MKQFARKRFYKWLSVSPSPTHIICLLVAAFSSLFLTLFLALVVPAKPELTAKITPTAMALKLNSAFICPYHNPRPQSRRPRSHRVFMASTLRPTSMWVFFPFISHWFGFWFGILRRPFLQFQPLFSCLFNFCCCFFFLAAKRIFMWFEFFFADMFMGVIKNGSLVLVLMWVVAIWSKCDEYWLESYGFIVISCVVAL